MHKIYYVHRTTGAGKLCHLNGVTIRANSVDNYYSLLLRTQGSLLQSATHTRTKCVQLIDMKQIKGASYHPMKWPITREWCYEINNEASQLNKKIANNGAAIKSAS